MENFCDGVCGTELPISTIDNNGHRMNGVMERGANGSISWSFNEKTSNPDNEFLKGIKSLSSFRISGQLTCRITYNRKYANIALLKIAYLLAFTYFGYGFLFNNNLELVRKQIRQPRDDILPNFDVFKYSIADELIGVNILTEPKELRSFIVIFKLKTNSIESIHKVLLPGPSEPGLKIYENLKIMQSSNEKRKIFYKIKKIPDLNFL